MQPLIKKNLTIKTFVLLCFVLIFACGKSKMMGNTLSTNREPYTLPFFDSLGFEYLYSAKIQFKEQIINGVLVVKKIAPDHKRVVLVSDFGNTIFNFEYLGNNAKSIYVLPDLNKKLIVNKLLLYFCFLTQSEYHIQRYQNNLEGSVKKKKVRIYPDAGRTKIVMASRWKEKAEITFFSTSKMADSIHFQSNELPLIMKFFKTKRD